MTRQLAAIYVRLSERGENEESITRQIETCTQRAKELGLTPVLYEEPKGVRSGYYESRRPAWKQLNKDLTERSNEYAAVIVADIARASRNAIRQMQFVYETDRRGIQVISLKEQIDPSTPMGRAFIGMTAVFSQWYRDDLSDRQKRRYRARDPNIYASNTAPFGMKRSGHYPNIVWSTTDDFPTIVEVFELYVLGLGAPTIAAELNRRERTWINRRGERSHVSTNTLARVIVKAERYKQFLDPILFNQVIQLRNAKQREHLRITKRTHPPLLLSGLLYCPYCKCLYRPGTTTTKYRIYRYYYHWRRDCILLHATVRLDVVEPLFWQSLEFLKNLSSETKEQLVAALVQPHSTAATLDIQVKRSRLLTRLENYEQMCADQDISRERFRELKAQIEKELAELPFTEVPKSIPIPEKDARLLVENLHTTLQVGATLAPDQMNQLLHTLIRRVWFDGSAITSIEWREPLNQVLEGVF